MTRHRTIVLSLIAVTAVFALLYLSGFEAEAADGGPERVQPGPWSEQGPAMWRPAADVERADELRVVVATTA
jgi:hypothetical protein